MFEWDLGNLTNVKYIGKCHVRSCANIESCSYFELIGHFRVVSFFSSCFLKFILTHVLCVGECVCLCMPSCSLWQLRLHQSPLKQILKKKKKRNKSGTCRFSRNTAEKLQSEKWQTLCPAYQSELNQKRILFYFGKNTEHGSKLLLFSSLGFLNPWHTMWIFPVS